MAELTNAQKLNVLGIAIEFLNTIPEWGFVRNQQTKDFKKENLNKFHCVIGWLFVCTNSPFYDETKTIQNPFVEVPDYNYLHVRDQDPVGNYFVEELRLVHINNNAPGSIKQTLLAHLYNEYANLISQETIDDLLKEKQPEFNPELPSKRMGVISRIKNFVKNITSPKSKSSKMAVMRKDTKFYARKSRVE